MPKLQKDMRYPSVHLRKKILKASFLFAAFFVIAFSAQAQNCQTITAHITSTVPAADPSDTIIKICKGTTVTFHGNASFSVSGANATYEWVFKDGVVLPGTAASRTFPNEGVYVVDFVVHDSAGCVNKNCDSRRAIYVSTTPHFNESVIPDTVCLNKLSVLNGIVTPVPGEYDCAPPVADTTFLPDGSGVSYTTSINVSCFTPCDTVRSVADIEQICLTMEHSFLGDLDWKIICPNNQETSLKNNGTGGGTILGNPVATDLPIDGSSATLLQPGTGFTYCFSPTSTNGFIYSPANWTNVSPYTDPIGNVSTGNPINQANAGTYQADGNWANLIGCPLNGDWTIKITDHLAADNGYIFNWSIDFSQSLGDYTFVPTYPQKNWDAHPDIVSTSNGTATIRPVTNGNSVHCYTFRVVDAFNCPYDTTFCVYVVDPGNPGEDSTAKICLNQDPVQALDYLAGNPEPGGTWTGPGITPGGMFNPAAVGVGFHEVVYTQRKWNCDTTASVVFEVVNDVSIDFSIRLGPACDQDTVYFTNLSDTGKYWWNFGDGTLPEDTVRHPAHIYADQDVYNVRLTVRNMDGCIDSVIKPIDIRHPLVAAFTTTPDSVCQTPGTPVQFTNTSAGAVTNWHWDFDDGATSTQSDPVHTFSLAGTRSVRLIVNDKIPCYDTVYHNVYVDSLPFLSLQLDRHAICAGEKLNLAADYLHPALSLNWDFGDGIHWQQADATSHNFEQPGEYTITVTADYPVCPDAVVTDSVVVNSFPVVYLGPDSVLCLDGSSLTIGDLTNAGNPAASWVWNTGSTASSIKVVHPGTYRVTATLHDCSTTEDIVVNKDCYTDIPNAFSPNGDGQNDYFYPRQLLSEGVAGFTMTVYNRWGQKVFETGNPNGRGWDGKFNDKDQPVGVYIYQIRVMMKNGRTEEYTGNVTLIR